MPIYEYICENCQTVVEKYENINNKEKTICKKCKKDMKKIISNCSFRLVGTGWYETDFKGK